MKNKVVADADVVTYVVDCKAGDEAVAELNQHFVAEEAPELVTAAQREFLD